MGALEKFLHNDPVATPTLIKAALSHVQFETIHPFLDGNGRLGRLLITLILCAENVLKEPLLYLSLYFKIHRGQYYDLLGRVRTDGDWQSWLEFFLKGVKSTSEQAAHTATRLLKLFDEDRDKIQKLGRPAGSALRVHQYLKRKPLTTVPTAARTLNLTRPTVRTSIRHLVDLGIVKEISARRRNRLYSYDTYIKILSEGTEPL
jgi:Fic family protein